MGGLTSTELKRTPLPQLRSAIDKAIDDALTQERIVGTVVLVSIDGSLTYQRAAGFADREAGRRMQLESIFLLSSVTKPIVTAAALALIDKGVMHLDDAVSTWLPDFSPRLSDGSLPRVTLRHLLTHSAGLSYAFMERGDGPYQRLAISTGLDNTNDDLSDLIRKLNAVPLAYRPGEGWGYSMSLDVLGAVIERATERTLSDAVATLVTSPLQMEDTAFSVVDRSRLVTHYGNATPRPRRLADDDAIPFFGNPVRFSPVRIFNTQAFPSSGAGMAGTAGDILRLLECLRTGGTPILKRETARSMFEMQAKTAGTAAGPGWEFGFGGAILASPEDAGSPQSPGTLQWDGAYGHKWFIDPDRRLSIVALTNTAFEGMIGRFTTDLRDALYRSL